MVVAERYIFVVLWYCLCILSCIDTHLFIYTSLSQTLFPAVACLLMVLLHASACLLRKRVPDFCNIQIIALLLASYMMLHGLMIKEAELYKQGYMACTLLLLVVLVDIVKADIMEKRHIENGIILICSINILFFIGQYLGVISSDNPFFRLSGPNGNPNIAAITLTVSIPFAIQRIRQGKHIGFMTFLLILVLTFILVLKCRTAFVGMFCIIVCYALKSQKARLFFTSRARKKTLVLVWTCFTVSIVTLCILGYNWKKDSADGRVFIWKRNCEMITKSLWGYGYGKYEIVYNKYQSQYFSSHKEEYARSTLATATSSAYNDILEHGVQGGVMGAALYMAFILLPAYQAYRERNLTCLTALSAIIVMSTTNSICCSISPWMMTISTMAMVGSRSRSVIPRRWIRLPLALWYILLSVVLLQREIGFIKSQKSLFFCMKNENRDIETIKGLSPTIGTSEAYYKYLAECYETTGNYSAADACYSEARKYTSAPLVLVKNAMCKEKKGDVPSAIGIMQEAVFMLPGNLSLKYHLMMLYDRAHDKYHTQKVASEIVSTPCKRENESTYFIKEEAAAKLKEQ